MFYGHTPRMDNGPADGDFAAYVERLTQRNAKAITEPAEPDSQAAPVAPPTPAKKPKAAERSAPVRSAPARTTASGPPTPEELLGRLGRWLKMVQYGTLGFVILLAGITWLLAVVVFDHPTDYGWVPIVLIAVGFKLLQLAGRARRQKPSSA